MGGEKRSRGDSSSTDESSDEHGMVEIFHQTPEVVKGTWCGSTYGPEFENGSLPALEWLVYPMQQDTFFETYFETKPFHIRLGKSGRSRFSSLFSEEEIFSLVKQKRLKYGLDLDVTIVKDGVRNNYNFNKDDTQEYDVADIVHVKRRFKKDGCSLRVLHPQRFSDELWKFMYLLECCWGSIVGCNAYLTPAMSQGFAPHFDDIDAFILQVSGRKRWKLYKSVTESSVLPRYSSRDFSSEELSDPIFDDILESGDLLYLPRGVIHQAESLEKDSLHVTISVNQRNNYFEFLKTAFADALEYYANESIQVRRTLPPLYFFQDHEELENTAEKLIAETMTYVDIPATIGKAFSDFMLNRLPPPPSLRRYPKGPVKSGGKIGPDSRVTLTYPGSAFAEVDVSMENPTLFVYHCLSNAREIHQTGNLDNESTDLPPQLEVPLDCGFMLQTLLSSDCIQLDSLDDTGATLSSLDLAQALLDADILTVVT